MTSARTAVAGLLPLCLLIISTACAERPDTNTGADQPTATGAPETHGPAAATAPAPAEADFPAGSSAAEAVPADAAGSAERDGSAATPAAATGATVYLDVRTREEYAAGHVDGTLHIPLDELPRRWQELETYRDRNVVVYCRTGRRSATAIELLRARGFDRLTNGGGLTDMSARGLPITR